MASLEFMAEACALLSGSVDVSAIENVKAYDWVALDDGELTVDVHAEVIDREGGHYSARVVTPRGVAMTAEFRFDRRWRLGGLPPLTDVRPWGIDVPHLYTVGRYGMFHGPVFHSMGEIHGWNDQGIDVSLTPCSLDCFFVEGHRPQLVLNPVLLDAMGQIVPCWLVQYVGPEFHSFPSTIERSAPRAVPAGVNVIIWLREEIAGLARITSGAPTVPDLMISSPASTTPFPLVSTNTSQAFHWTSSAQLVSVSLRHSTTVRLRLIASARPK
jgi:hypothetical protein